MGKKAMQDLLDAETWMTASEALSYGFTDKVAKPSAAPPVQPGEGDQQDAEEECQAMSGLATSVMAKFKNAPEKLRPRTVDLIKSMEQRIMGSSERASPQAPAGKPAASMKR